MGHYIHPGNENFKFIANTFYIDKSGLISVVNRFINTERMLLCVSRPRRFGKSYAVKMLAAYYDCSCDSHELFDGLSIAKDESYEEHLNKYHVLYLDITGFLPDTTIADLPSYIRGRILKDIRREFEGFEDADSVKEALAEIIDKTGKKFIAIIDEWDAPIRTSGSTPNTQLDFLEFLRFLFKSEITQKVFAVAYMTGILPVRKDGSQSAISEFLEYTILDPQEFGPYAGFTEGEVRKICFTKGVSFLLGAKLCGLWSTRLYQSGF